MKKFLFLCLIFMPTILFSQSDKQIYNIGGNILAKGKVTCERTNEPVETEIEFRGSNGKKIRTRSNSITGNWEQILPPDKYTVLLHSWNVARKTYEIEVEPNNKYKEITKDFTVVRLLPGDELLQIQFFKTNSTEVQSDLSEFIQQIKDIMKFNRGAEFTFYVSASDMFKPVQNVQLQENPKPSDKKEKSKTSQSSKKAELKQEPQNVPDYTTLLNQRYAVMKSLLSEAFTQNSKIKLEIDVERNHTSYPNNLSVKVSNNYDVFGTKR